MNNLDICKRIAEIDGFDYFRLTDQGYMAFNEGINSSVTDRMFFNPLTDKALCFDLMVKYRVCIGLTGGDDFRATVFDWNPDKMFIGRGETLQKAICLAIIEANKSQTKKYP